MWQNWYHTSGNGNRNGPDLVEAFQKKLWVEYRFYSALNLPPQFRHKCTSGGNQQRYADVKIGKVETKHQEKLQKQSSMMVVEDTEYFQPNLGIWKRIL